MRRCLQSLVDRLSRPSTRRTPPALQVEELEDRRLLDGSVFSPQALVDRYVGQLYQDLLGRSPDPVERTSIAALLNQGQAGPEQVAQVLLNSPEGTTRQVEDLYEGLLGRSANPVELAIFTPFLEAGGSTDLVKALIIGSPEYFQVRGGSTAAGFLSALYQDGLGRDLDPLGAAVWDGWLASTSGQDQEAVRTAVADQVLASAEGQQYVVENCYLRYLHRAPNRIDLAYWGAGLRAGLRDQDLVAGLTCSPEYVGQLQDDVVLDWNATALEAIRRDNTAPPLAARNLAMVQVAVYDAVDAVEPLHQAYLVHPAVPADTSPEAAAAAAAYRVLLALYPGQQALFDAALVSSLATIPDGLGKIDGIVLGLSVADAVLADRSGDGANAVVSYPGGTAPGEWRPTPPGFAAAVLPQWPEVKPFTLTSGSQFRPPPPPALDSPEYGAALNEVESLGRSDSSTRTADQTQIASFWADGSGTATPPGHWNEIAAEVARMRGNTLAENARLFALLDLALADAGIACWDAKYAYGFWRPITAIRQADMDGNPLTTADPTWTPLLVTPSFPSYVSGHSTFSGAAADVLTAFFGPNVAFQATSDALPGVVRSFQNFTQAADEAGLSRIYGGIHYSFDNQQGLVTGRQVGQYVVDNFLQ